MGKIRVLIAKFDPNESDRGVLVISQALKDHGMEVIYPDLKQSPLQIANTAIQDNVDVIGVLSFSGAHNTLFPEILEELENKGASDIPVIGGGVIPSEDIPLLLESGIKQIFTNATSTEDLAFYIKQLIDQNVVEPPKQIAHIGIAVNSIDDTLPFYTDALGLTLEGTEDVESEAVRVAFLKIGETRFELLEPLNDSSAIKGYLDKKGEGIHHIAVEVDDIDRRLNQLKTQGIKLIHEKAKAGAHDSRIAFIHPKATHGVLFELVQERESGDQ